MPEEKEHVLNPLIAAAILIAFTIVAAYALSWWLSQSIEQKVIECKKDSDCFAAPCCHSVQCYSKMSFIQKCDYMCTQECRFRTMDCGCGHCGCIDGECQVAWTREYTWC
jgi:flagellin-like protein